MNSITQDELDRRLLLVSKKLSRSKQRMRKRNREVYIHFKESAESEEGTK